MVVLPCMAEPGHRFFYEFVLIKSADRNDLLSLIRGKQHMRTPAMNKQEGDHDAFPGKPG
jgi:hypothetical protein